VRDSSVRHIVAHTTVGASQASGSPVVSARVRAVATSSKVIRGSAVRVVDDSAAVCTVAAETANGAIGVDASTAGGARPATMLRK